MLVPFSSTHSSHKVGKENQHVQYGCEKGWTEGGKGRGGSRRQPSICIYFIFIVVSLSMDSNTLLTPRPLLLACSPLLVGCYYYAVVYSALFHSFISWTQNFLTFSSSFTFIWCEWLFNVIVGITEFIDIRAMIEVDDGREGVGEPLASTYKCCPEHLEKCPVGLFEWDSLTRFSVNVNGFRFKRVSLCVHYGDQSIKVEPETWKNYNF